MAGRAVAGAGGYQREGSGGGRISLAGDYAKAIEYHSEDLTMAKEVGGRAGEGRAYGNLGNAYESQGAIGRPTKATRSAWRLQRTARPHVVLSALQAISTPDIAGRVDVWMIQIRLNLPSYRSLLRLPVPCTVFFWPFSWPSPHASAPLAWASGIVHAPCSGREREREFTAHATDFRTRSLRPDVSAFSRFSFSFCFFSSLL